MSKNWTVLNHQQLGTYAEYYAKMAFVSFGWYVFTSETDDHGIDFVVSPPRSGVYYEVQVKSLCKSKYAFISKNKMNHDPQNDPLPENRLVCFLKFADGKDPDIYVIPAKEWENPNELLKNYTPEWGIAVSGKSQPLLENYAFDKAINSIAAD